MSSQPTLSSQLTTLFAEVAIMVLGAIAINKGMDGAIFGTCIASLAGLGGYHIQKVGSVTTTAIKANSTKKDTML